MTTRRARTTSGAAQQALRYGRQVMMRVVILAGVGVMVVIAVVAIVLAVRDIRNERPMSRRTLTTFCVAGAVAAATIAYAVL
jgi:energy-converting hydrogenase Eha subunit A